MIEDLKKQIAELKKWEKEKEEKISRLNQRIKDLKIAIKSSNESNNEPKESTVQIGKK